MRRYKVAVSLDSKNSKDKIYTIDADSIKKAELKARKLYAEDHKLKSIRHVEAFGIRIW